ncbi:MAG TPA: hypothetical protein VKB88_46405 [Bryobacteraceae bacterium]|nr:hypothetical protein [Bryobacteraceae bacterium]
MVKSTNELTRNTPATQGAQIIPSKPLRIGASTPYDFAGANMTAYGGLLPAATVLEKMPFQQVIEEHVTRRRVTSSMLGFRLVLAMVLAL